MGIEFTRSYSADDVSSESGCCDVPTAADNLFASAFIRATKRI